jgi:hypothetical protein
MILALLLLAVAFNPRASGPLLAGGGQPPVTISLLPASNIVHPGDTFTIDVALDMQTDSHAISFVTLVLDFDPSVLEATAFNPNTAAYPQLQVIAQTPLEPGVGRIGLQIGIGSIPVFTIQSSGTIAIITFQAVGQAGDATGITWERAEALSLSAWDDPTENVVGTTDDASLCIGSCSSPPTSTATATSTPKTPTVTSTIVPPVTPTPRPTPPRYYRYLALVKK